MIVGITGDKRVGKGIIGVGLMLYLMAECGYSPSDACGNQTILVEGYRRFDNKQMGSVLTAMVARHIRGKLFYVAEADRAFPPRYWHRPEQTDALIGLQQEQKLCDWLIYDTHFHGVDVLLEDATQIFLYPKYYPEDDIVKIRWWRNHSMMDRPIPGAFFNVSKWIFPY